ncbi:MAG: polyprenyl synthetase family protein, partial [Planctomycetota bacterium]|nr:polyprenyl synthetase family protein [Planctomycetota bacterium]
MATVTPNASLSGDDNAAIQNGKVTPTVVSQKMATANGTRKQSTLKVVPQSLELREQILACCTDAITSLDRARPLGKPELESIARQILTEEALSHDYVGWTMVILASEFWRLRVQSVPYQRRLLLLPPAWLHNGASKNHSPADETATTNGKSLFRFRRQADELGYQVLNANDVASVVKAIVSGQVDAILGVASLALLEKAIDQVLPAGIPCMAIPLLDEQRPQDAVDAAWVQSMIELPHCVNQGGANQADPPFTNYAHLMRAAAEMFQGDQLEAIAPRVHRRSPTAKQNGTPLTQTQDDPLAGINPLAGTEAIAYDFLGKGGKYSRPFITLAVYDSLTGGNGTRPHGDEHLRNLPLAIRRVAMSIEAFHKASLVHDDIEDDDSYRYGQPTLHRQFGTPTAINIGDYLIGLGYRLVSREKGTLGAEIVCDIVDRLADAHLKLSEGQGAELLWRDSRNKQLTSA